MEVVATTRMWCVKMKGIPRIFIVERVVVQATIFSIFVSSFL